MFARLVQLIVGGAAISSTNPVPVTQGSTSGSTAATVASAFKTVAATATPERLAASTTLVSSVVLQGYKSSFTINAGNVAIGTASGDGTQPIVVIPGASVSITAPPGKFIDLNLIWIDVATNGDGVGYFSIV